VTPGTRRFVAVRARSRGGVLDRLVDRVDGVFDTFNLPPYYEERELHCTMCSYPTTAGLALAAAAVATTSHHLVSPADVSVVSSEQATVSSSSSSSSSLLLLPSSSSLAPLTATLQPKSSVAPAVGAMPNGDLGQTVLSISDEIAAHDEAIEATNQPACRLGPTDPDVPSESDVSELSKVFRDACDDLAVDTDVRVTAVRWITGDKAVKISLT
jgi:hypothetical protein